MDQLIRVLKYLNRQYKNTTDLESYHYYNDAYWEVTFLLWDWDKKK